MALIDELKAAMAEWRTSGDRSYGMTEYDAGYGDGLTTAYQSCADIIEELLSKHEEKTMYRVLYTRPGEKAPYASKPLVKVDAEALGKQYHQQGLVVSLSEVTS